MFFRKCVWSILSLIFLACSAPTHALTPPLSPAELMEDADLAVEGEVTGEVVCLGKTVANKCFDRYDYRTELKVLKVLKGKAKKKKAIPVHFYHNDYSKSKCVGDQGATLHSGDIGVFYLKKSDQDYYYPFHWTAAEIKSPGSQGLPPCK